MAAKRAKDAELAQLDTLAVDPDTRNNALQKALAANHAITVCKAAH